MELYFSASAVKHRLDFFETQMQCLRFPRHLKKGNKKTTDIIYGMLEPIKLYRYIFPENNLHCVLNTLGIPHPNYSMFNKQSFLLRKALNAKKIPKADSTVPPVLIDRDNIAIKEIGLKYEKTVKFPDGTIKEAI